MTTRPAIAGAIASSHGTIIGGNTELIANVDLLNTVNKHEKSWRYSPESTVNMAAKALSLRPSITLPKWHTSMDMRRPPVDSRRMYRHSATMHSHSTPTGRVGCDKGLAERKELKKKRRCIHNMTVGREHCWGSDGTGVVIGIEEEERWGGGGGWGLGRGYG